MQNGNASPGHESKGSIPVADALPAQNVCFNESILNLFCMTSS